MKKKRFKEFIKKQWKWLVTSGFFLIGGLVVALVGAHMNGWSIMRWLSSPYATTFFIIFILGAIVLVLLLLEMKRRSLGDDE